MKSLTRFLCALTAILAFDVSAATVPKEYFGLHIQRIDNGTAWPEVAFGSWRLWDANTQWTQLQPARDTWQFSRLDGYVDLAARHGVSLLLPLGLSPRWASARPDEPSAYGEGRAAEPASLDDWRNYVRAVATRYKGRINTYEIWNEPNDKQFFSGSTAKLVELTCEARKVLKAVDPAITLVGPAYTGEQNVGKLEGFLAAGGKNCIDVVSYHLYVALSPPEAIPPLVTNIRQAMKRQGVAQLPLWNTETGWRIENTDGSPEKGVPDYWIRVGSEQSAAFVARAYLLGSAYGVDRFYWYSWDHGTLGLVEPRARKLKPGGAALGVVAGWMTGRPRPVCREQAGFWQCSLGASETERQLVIWTAGKPYHYSIPQGWTLVSAETASGARIVSAPGRGLDVRDMPQRLVLAREATPGK